MPTPNKVIMLGATCAVGNHTALTLSTMPSVKKLTLPGKRPAENIVGKSVSQQKIDKDLEDGLDLRSKRPYTAA